MDSDRLLSYRFILILIGVCTVLTGMAQDMTNWVDPFIGTGKSNSLTKWGNYGGTYPGAVSPWGMVQMTPETSIRPGEKGYYYEDSVIRTFSCVNHKSGFPNGSSGNIHFLFYPEAMDSPYIGKSRPFSHAGEIVTPGYYSVYFPEGDKVELTASTRSGMIRYSAGNKRITVGLCRAGEISVTGHSELQASYMNGIIRFNKPWEKLTTRQDTLYMEFDLTEPAEPLCIRLGVSYTGVEGSRKNMETEQAGWNFDFVRQRTREAWEKELSVIELPVARVREKKIFYTALYHSLLLPNICSDVDGRYKGADGNIHQSKGKATYAGFSTWDTFRSLHPLLALLKPDVQADMNLSLQQHYEESGRFPGQPMTGFHIIPVLLDSYVKGIQSFDVGKMYKGMRACLLGDNTHPAVQKYQEYGYVPDSLEQSVTLTMEYAYNDWALSRFATILGHPGETHFLLGRSFSYANLFDTETLFMLPRNSDGFVRNPGEMGYQESDKYTTTFFVPHNIQDLINRMGGEDTFISLLAQCYGEQRILHDNEPVFHYPYLFSYAGRPDLTAQYVHAVLQNDYNDTPGGIPGNDDLGSLSSWYVLSAMGLFPVCPGTPEYITNIPLFEKILVHLPGGETLIVTKEGKGNYAGSITFRGKTMDSYTIDHNELVKGGYLSYKISEWQGKPLHCKKPYSVTSGQPDIQLINSSVAQNQMISGQTNTIQVELSNKGAAGTKELIICSDGLPVAQQRIYLPEEGTVHQEIPFQLYEEKRHIVSIGKYQYEIEVNDISSVESPFVCTAITGYPVVQEGDPFLCEVTYKNISGKTHARQIPVFINDTKVYENEYVLKPGEEISYQIVLGEQQEGVSHVKTLGKDWWFKCYADNLSSTLIDLDMQDIEENRIRDKSGLNNHARIMGNAISFSEDGLFTIKTEEGGYLKLPMSESLMLPSNTITLSTWVKPLEKKNGYVDFFTKGDYTLLKMEGPETLVFFAGGWGRGACKTKVSDNWYGSWHHVAGVCTGDKLLLYIDGELKETVEVRGNIEYTEVPWNIGRNAEMPYSRFFDGLFKEVTIYKEPLSAEDIRHIYLKNNFSRASGTKKSLCESVNSALVDICLNRTNQSKPLISLQ